MFAIDTSTIRLSPDFDVIHLESRTAFLGELIEVQIGPGFTRPVTSDPTVLAPIDTDWFVAAKPGNAWLSAATIRCDRCEMATYLWRVAIEVRLPGT